MSKNLTRRDFVAGSAAAAGLLGLAACSNTGTTETTDTAADGIFAAPAADAYPIDPDGADVEALWTSEETRDGWTKITNPEGGPVLGVMDASKIIQVNGLAFKDLNGSGKLDLYEDWRQDNATRAASLAESMPAEDCLKLMWHGGPGEPGSLGADTQDFSGIEQGSRAGVSRLGSTIASYATDIAWINQVQATAEKSLYGIPYLNSSDPYTLFNIPDSVTLSAAMDKDVWRKAGMWTARAWSATGVRCDLGPQIDVYSSPIGCRLSGSVSEDPALNRDFAQAYGGGMQSTWGDDEATDDQGWGTQSVGVMLKHYVGEGCSEGGRNDHVDQGKWNVFPGGNFEAHLVPFLDGGLHLDSKTEQMASIMPCYSIDYDPNDPELLGEQVGVGYNKKILGLLRSAGWDGMICSDWQILTAEDYGVENLSEEERYAKMVMAGTEQHGGFYRPDLNEPAYEIIKKELGEDEALKLVQTAARHITKFMFDVTLFENPYSDRTVAKKILESEAASAFGLEAAKKCVIMLKNDDVISEAGLDGKVYIPQKFIPGSSGWFGSTPATVEQCFGNGMELPFEVITDEVGEPTGVAEAAPAGGPGMPGASEADAEPAEPEPAYQESDIIKRTADELTDVKYAIIHITDPRDAHDGYTGGADMMGNDSGEPVEWLPVTRQYRPYTADGKNVRKESLNGNDCYGEYENRSYYGKSTTATNEGDLDLVLDTKKKLPKDAKLICVIDCKNPMVFSELEPSCDAIILAMNGVGDEAYASIISGEVEPSGLLPFQMPKDMDTIEANCEDVPRDLDCYEDAAGNVYDFCFGLNWSGVIDDERVATYKVAPLTKPETTFEWPEA